MALSAEVNFEIRNSGSADNPGGFKAGATGSDYTLQDAAQATLSTSTVVHSTTTQINVHAGDHTVHANDVGNTIKVSVNGGAADVFEITAVDVANNRWTVDRAVGTAGQTVAGKLGGASDGLHSVGAYNTTDVLRPGQKVWVKAGTYTRTASTSFNLPANNFFEQNSRRALRIIGYNATRGDTPTGNDRPLIQLSTNTGLTGLDFPTVSSNASPWLENLRVDGGSLGTSSGITVTGTSLWGMFYNCKVSNCTSKGLEPRGESQLIECEATGISGATGAIRCQGGDMTLIRCYSHDNTITGIHCNFKSALVYQCVSESNSGASSDGFFMLHGFQFIGNIAYNNGRDGLRFTDGTIKYNTIHNNIFVGNGAYGMNITTNTIPRLPMIFHHNAFYNNTTAAVNGWSDTSGSNGTGAYGSDPNITLTGDPFTNAAGADFTLNNTAGAGAACRAAGMPGTPVNGLSVTGYLDVGPFQHEDAAVGGGGAPRSAGMTGGIF